ncbi:MAG: O-antigen ligase family protein [Phycisphaerales bacterium]|jgi:O-antigen ligase
MHAERLVLGFFSKPFAKDAIERAQAGPRWLWWLHLIGALAWTICVCGRTTYVEVGGALLWLVTFVRMPWVWRAFVMGLAHPLFLAIVAWTAWRAISLLWSPDVEAGVDRIDKLRFAWNIPFLLPLAPVVGTLAVGLVCGFLIYNLSQLSHGLSRAGLEWLPQWDRMPNRNAGWNEPVAGGTNLCAALGLHLGALLYGRRGWAALGGVGVVITLAAILATGTRGAWLAAAGLVGLACLAGAWKIRWTARRAIVAGVVLLVVAIGGGVVGWKVAAPRALEAREELRQVFEDKDFSSYTGTRLLLMWWAVQAFADNPIGGTGEGGYQPWVLKNLAERGIDPADRTHTGPHPHNTLLQPLANTGAIGLALYVLVLLIMARLAWVMRLHDHPYAAGVPWALLGLFAACMFEVMHMNTHVLAMWMLLLGLAVAGSVDYVLRHDRAVGGDVELEGALEE